MTFANFLQYIGTPDGVKNIIATIFLFFTSFAADWVPGFTEIPPKWKRLWMMILSFAIPLAGSYLMGTFNETWWAALATGFTAYFGNQIAHAREL